LVLNYSLGLAFTWLPEINLKHKGINSFPQICPHSLKDSTAATVFDKTLMQVTYCTLGLQIGFYLLQSFAGNDQSDLWLHAKHMNSYILSTIFAVLTLVQFPLTLICFTIAFTQIFLSPLLPQFRA
jgi:hypothetical protein